MGAAWHRATTTGDLLMMRVPVRLLLACLTGLVLTCGFVVPASAGTFQTTAKWKNCDNTTSAISIRGTFTDPARYHGKGRYMVKKWIRWDYLQTRGQWRAADTWASETRWVKVNNLSWDFVSTAADRTNWAGLYYDRWRAHVTIKLIKNRPGPRDKTVEVIDIFPMKGSFTERGSNCWEPSVA
jgi:hypothetical protein